MQISPDSNNRRLRRGGNNDRRESDASERRHGAREDSSRCLLHVGIAARIFEGDISAGNLQIIAHLIVRRKLDLTLRAGAKGFSEDAHEIRILRHWPFTTPERGIHECLIRKVTVPVFDCGRSSRGS